MIMDLNLENFVSGGVFKYGIDSVFREIPASSGSPEQFVFLILFNSEANNDKKIVISTKSLRYDENENGGEIKLLADNYENGAKLMIKNIPEDYTKNYLSVNETSKVDGFAFVRCTATKETASMLEKEPDFEDTKAKVILKGKLNNNPTFSYISKVSISPFEIKFGVEI